MYNLIKRTPPLTYPSDSISLRKMALGKGKFCCQTLPQYFCSFTQFPSSTYAYLRKKLQTSKKINAVKRINDKEQRIMRDIDHKISHDIVETAVAHNVKVIKLEHLQNIRSTTRKSRKNNHSLHTWSFYRLAQFIEYKAKLAGISVEYVDSAYTSQRCPICGSVHHADDRNYTCECGFHIHRDLLGAMNICNSTEFVGNRQTA